MVDCLQGSMYTGTYNLMQMLTPIPGPSCSKLKTLLVNISIKFQMLISENTSIIFVEKK